eukprot:NODE_7196_length_1600_cov_3.285811.p1 GENE.NODE_7196_length_1600_cov_3.285811~~NODE_7196_length_1600_cov_3.285811.p1  ORF type:complete len:448 (-),score=55.77 NODE_7196_length_1600_cov_3.285811:198-1541(-)
MVAVFVAVLVCCSLCLAEARQPGRDSAAPPRTPPAGSRSAARSGGSTMPPPSPQGRPRQSTTLHFPLVTWQRLRLMARREQREQDDQRPHAATPSEMFVQWMRIRWTTWRATSAELRPARCETVDGSGGPASALSWRRHRLRGLGRPGDVRIAAARSRAVVTWATSGEPAHLALNLVLSVRRNAPALESLLWVVALDAGAARLLRANGIRRVLPYFVRRPALMDTVWKMRWRLLLTFLCAWRLNEVIIVDADFVFLGDPWQGAHRFQPAMGVDLAVQTDALDPAAHLWQPHIRSVNIRIHRARLCPRGSLLTLCQGYWRWPRMRESTYVVNVVKVIDDDIVLDNVFVLSYVFVTDYVIVLDDIFVLFDVIVFYHVIVLDDDKVTNYVVVLDDVIVIDNATAAGAVEVIDNASAGFYKIALRYYLVVDTHVYCARLRHHLDSTTRCRP